MIKMAVTSVVILMVLLTGVVQADGSDYYPEQKALENALLTEKTLNSMRQVFFPVFGSRAQEVQRVRIYTCLEITVDQSLNFSSDDDYCIASDLKIDGNNDNTSLCWEFLWTDSAFLSLITVDQLVAFDVCATVIYHTALQKGFHYRVMEAYLPLTCSVMPNNLDIKMSLMLLLSWSKSYARYHGVPPQWEEKDKGYIQESYAWHYVTENTYKHNSAHSIRLGMTLCFISFNVLVMVIVIVCSKKFCTQLQRTMSGSTRLAAVMWAIMITLMLVNSLYLFATIIGLSNRKYPHPRVWKCLIADADWCASMKSTKLYSDEVVSLLVKLTVVPFAIAIELIAAVRLTSRKLLLFPWIIATTPSQCYSFTIGKVVLQTILIWNIMIFIQIIAGVVLLPFIILIVIVPVTAMSAIGAAFISLIVVAFIIAYFIFKWCNPISFKRCCSLVFCFHVFIAAVILFAFISALTLYYHVIRLGVQPWSVKGSIVSLLPTLLITPLLWFAKKYFFKKDRATEDVEDGLSMTAHHQLTGHQENIQEEELEEEEEEVNNEERNLVSVV